QICLLDAMSSSKQNQVFNHYRQNLLLIATWLDGLYHYQTDFLTRKCTIERICDTLPEGKLSEFLFVLNARQSKVGAYFLICLEPQDFQEFIFTVPPS